MFFIRVYWSKKRSPTECVIFSVAWLNCFQLKRENFHRWYMLAIFYLWIIWEALQDHSRHFGLSNVLTFQPERPFWGILLWGFDSGLCSLWLCAESDRSTVNSQEACCYRINMAPPGVVSWHCRVITQRPFWLMEESREFKSNLDSEWIQGCSELDKMIPSH